VALAKAEATCRGNKTKHGKEPPAQENNPVLAEGQSRDQLGDLFGVSGKSVDQARKVLRD
jgi:hypothetical protein